MMEVVYSLAITLWTIVRITVSNPLLLTVALGSLSAGLIERYARS